ncbi:cbb3-type cytochrome oxidase assembly protein CcoS [Marinobacterium jannaschii]|uniref:cbb3-type cytochrome oxidase assembly protein CcoS n=1 Tax=Marinobacterium jannaschii TaxID=64970 RepID=UPI000486211F|nr:cbb3-type cytochrome oxidase assembly protein CcoS [Marinobacterium jannaschii]
MDIIYLLIPIAIVLAGFAVWAFFWSVNTGQYDDLESPAHSILFEDDDALIPDDAKQRKDD